MTILERLARKSHVSEDGCFVWGGGHLARGYGCIRIKGKQQLAHRAAWAEHNGPIPNGLRVLHRCDNPPCWNEAHLFLGTAADNTADMFAKGRFRPGKPNVGTRNGRATLTDAEVLEIKRRLSTSRRNGRALAREFFVSDTVISRIKRGETWRHLGLNG